MEGYQVKVEDISRKVGVLLARYNELKEDNEILQRENKELKRQLDAQAKAAKEIGESAKILKISGHLANRSENEKIELKRKINEFIKEIDKCVALLNN